MAYFGPAYTDCPLRAQCIRKPHISVYRQVTFFDGSRNRIGKPNNPL